MWIGTSKGLCRYDGHTFKHYTRKEGFPISDDDINELMQDSDGLIWIGTNVGGLNVYDPVSDSVRVFIHETNNPNSIPGNRVSSIAEGADGHIWVGFNNNIGLSKIHKETGVITNYDPFASVTTAGVKSIRGIIFDTVRPDTIWLGTTSGLIAFDTKKEHFHIVDHPLKKINRHGLFDTYRLNENQIAGAFFHAGVDIYNIKEAQWNGTTSPLEDPIRAFSIAKKSEEELWIAIRKKGLAVFNQKTNQITRVPSDLKDFQSPLPGLTSRVYADDKSLWVGSIDGVSYYDSRQISFPFDSLPFSRKEYGRVTDASAKYNKTYMTAFGEGLWEFDKIDRSQQRKINFPGSENNIFYDVTETKDFVILNEENQTIIVFDKATEKQSKINISKQINGRFSLRYMTWWKDNLILLVTWLNGVHVLDLESQKVRSLFDSGLNPPNYHHALVTSDKTIWFSNDDNIVIYYPDTDSVSYYSPSSIPDKKKKRILSVAEAQDGTKWIGSLSGLIRLSDGQETLFNTFNTSLNSDNIRKILIDNDGIIWLETEGGISKVDPSTLHVTNYGAAEGIRPAGAFKLIDDEILVGQYGGYSLFHPDSITSPKDSPKICFTDFKVSNSSFSLEKHINHTDNIELSFNENFISFEFTSPALSKSQEIYFSYQLEGLDQDWINITNGRVANYTNLDGGDYTFLVKARNKDGEWTSPRSIAVHIAKPFWETWWFYSLCGLLLGSIAFVFYKTRINILQRRADQEAQELRLEAFQKRLMDLNASPPDLSLDFNEVNEKLTTPLSKREFEVLQMSLDGKTNAEIAERLFISLSTVKFHLRNTYSKLGVSNRKEALVYVVKKS